MLPRRIFRSTSRTAKKPANSLVNPWVSRMNSSAKQIPPQAVVAVSHARGQSCPYSEFPQDTQTYRVLVSRVDVAPGPAASEPEYAVNAPLSARRKAVRGTVLGP